MLYLFGQAVAQALWGPSLDYYVDPMKQGEWATKKHAQLTTSGTVHDFTGIPAGVKQIIIDFDGGCEPSR